MEYVVLTAIQFYTWLIIGYILMSWFPITGVFVDIYNVLGTIVDPYLRIFRSIIPPLGAVDISPIVAILVLNVIARLVSTVL